jgi:hypothetical protein
MSQFIPSYSQNCYLCSSNKYIATQNGRLRAREHSLQRECEALRAGRILEADYERARREEWERREGVEDTLQRWT